MKHKISISVDEERLKEWKQLHLDLIKKKWNITKEGSATKRTYVFTGGNLLQNGTFEYTGTGDPIGYGKNDFYNQSTAEFQFHNALAFSGHPKIRELTNAFPYELEKERWNPIYFESLIRAHPLKGTKILDLGCGLEPAFARITRLLGADTYTVDDHPALEFVYDPKSKLTKDWIDLESEKHIITNLNDLHSLETIISKSNGNFDLISASNLLPVKDYGADTPDNKILLSLTYAVLKDEGGFYLDLEKFPGKIKLGIKRDNGFLTIPVSYSDNDIQFIQVGK